MKNKMTMFLLTFVAGAIIGAAIVWMLCNCCCKTSCCSQQGKEKSDTTGIREISVQTANAYFKAYLNYPISVDTMQAYSINPEQYNAMKLIAASDPTVHGFRIYNGMDSLTPVRIVVGTGSPDRTKVIYATSDAGSGLCPYICDKSSPITK
jgi:hypothetical protein